MQYRFRCYLFGCGFIFSLSLSAFEENWRVKFVDGNAYLQPKLINIDQTKKLQNGFEFTDPLPYAIVTSKEAYLELELKTPFFQTLRLGQSTAIELSKQNEFFFFQGSALFSQRKQIHFILATESCQTVVVGNGTWLVEKTAHEGFKIVVLEGKLKVGNEKVDGILKAGDLAIVSTKEGKVSQSIKIELPLLLSSSRLLNKFPTKLDSQSRLISAAQVQAIRMKKKYEAFIGEVSPENKVRLWTIQEKSQK